MPTDEERWKEVMIESGQMPDDNGIWQYNPQAIENPYGWERTNDGNEGKRNYHVIEQSMSN